MRKLNSPPWLDVSCQSPQGSSVVCWVITAWTWIRTWSCCVDSEVETQSLTTHFSYSISRSHFPLFLNVESPCATVPNCQWSHLYILPGLVKIIGKCLFLVSILGNETHFRSFRFYFYMPADLKILLLRFNNLSQISCCWLGCLQLNDGLEYLLKILDSMHTPSRWIPTIHRGFH